MTPLCSRNGAWAAKAAEITESAIGAANAVLYAVLLSRTFVDVFTCKCHAGSSQMLLTYRLLAFLWCSAVAVIQFADKGFFVLKYYTVW